MRRAHLFIPFLSLPLLILFFSCSPRHDDDIARIDSLRVDAERLIRAQSLMSWNSWVVGAPSNQDSLYREFGGLFTQEHIALVDEAQAKEHDSVQRKRLHYLRRYLTTEFIAKELARLTDQVSNIEASATVTVDGKQIPYRQVSSLLANEPRQPRRAALYTATNTVLDTLNTLLRQIEDRNQQLARDLGYASYTIMAEALKDIDMENLRRTTDGILQETDSLYTGLLHEILRTEIGIPPDRFYRYDTGLLFRSRRFDPYFPSHAMLDVLRRTFTGLGIDFDAQKNLRIDAEPREHKNPRAVCFPIDVPNDVRISIKPKGGADDYAALFHEMGHGQHYAGTQEHALEFKYLGEYTVTETYAFLAEHLLANQAWLRQHGGMPTTVLKDFIRLQAFRRLYYIRRYSAKFLYELGLHDNAPNPHIAYSSLLSRALGTTPLPSDEKRHLTDVDALYYSATYLRAWFLEAQLSAMLTAHYGANWFENPQAGVFLRSLWARGDRLTGDELARELGYSSIAPEIMLGQIRQMVLFSTR